MITKHDNTTVTASVQGAVFCFQYFFTENIDNNIFFMLIST